MTFVKISDRWINFDLVARISPTLDPWSYRLVSPTGFEIAVIPHTVLQTLIDAGILPSDPPSPKEALEQIRFLANDATAKP